VGARIVFMGSPDFAVPILKGLITHHQVVGVVTQPDRPAGRGRKLKPPPVKELALRCGLPLLQPESICQEEAIAWLRERKPDVIVVAAFGQILPSSVLGIPPRGCLNVHASLLPRYRGAAPIPAAILAGDKETGVTIMLMDEGMDTGPILAQRSCPIERWDTAASLGRKLSLMGAELLLEVLPKWLEGRIKPRPQEGKASYARMLKKEDGIIDWTLPAMDIERRVRAYNPWPGAYTFWQGKLIKIWRAEASDSSLLGGTPGQVFRDREGVKVACGEGALLLKEIQMEGKKPMPVEDFVRGRGNFIGAILS